MFSDERFYAENGDRRKLLDAISIDSDGANIIDDALSCEKTEDGYQLKVFIVDVVYEIENTPYFRGKLENAHRLGISAYWPLNPTSLFSSRISKNMSLHEGSIRRAICVELKIDNEFNISSEALNVERVWVRNKKAYSFSQVKKILDDYDEDQEMVQMKILNELASGLLRRRNSNTEYIKHRHTLDVAVSGHSRFCVLQDSLYSVGAIIIREIMIVANQASANYCQRRNIPIIYSVMDDQVEEILEKKNKDKLFELMLNCALGLKRTTDYYSGFAEFSSYSMLGSDYHGQNDSVYAHFSSPMRRYPDIINQCQMIANLEAKKYRFSEIEIEKSTEHFNRVKKQQLNQLRQKILDIVMNSNLDAEDKNTFLRFRAELYVYELCRNANSFEQAKAEYIDYLSQFDYGQLYHWLNPSKKGAGWSKRRMIVIHYVLSQPMVLLKMARKLLDIATSKS